MTVYTILQQGWIPNHRGKVEKLKCKVCAKYKDRIISRKNFSGKWIDGADSVRTTNLIDHASQTSMYMH